ncbi:ABC transporter ATP-binding protein [Thermotoga sp. KOL6]|nr:ABC transporter ATP-binding protein [Thermotoga sp. KOL6]
MRSEPILKGIGICKDFSGVRVLHNIDIEIFPKKVYGLVGENGAGKSTLMKILSGFLQPTEGRIFVDGNEEKLSPLKARDKGIILVPQELNLVDTLHVYENIFLGEEITKGVFLDKRKMVSAANETLKEIGLDISSEELVQNLSPAQKQMIEIAKALVKKARVLIFDEPTSSLTDEEVERLFEVIKKLKENGLSIIFISHRLKEVLRIADELIVLRDGKKVFQGPNIDLSEKSVAEMMVGRTLEKMFPTKSSPGTGKILEVKGLSTKDGSVKNASFNVFEGEIVGFYGLVGSGRTELMEALIGLREIRNGEIVFQGRKVRIESPDVAKRLGIVYLPEDRKTGGIIPTFEAFKNTTLMSLKKHINKGLINAKSELSTFGRYIEEFDIRVRSPFQLITTLSGGNQQKVVISKLVETKAKILIFDEPTKGVDVNAKHQIYEIMRRLVERDGVSIIMVSSELPEIIGMCNRCYVMRSGEIVACLEEKDLTENNIIYHATGVSV